MWRGRGGGVVMNCDSSCQVYRICMEARCYADAMKRKCRGHLTNRIENVVNPEYLKFWNIFNAKIDSIAISVLRCELETVMGRVVEIW